MKQLCLTLGAVVLSAATMAIVAPAASASQAKTSTLDIAVSSYDQSATADIMASPGIIASTAVSGLVSENYTGDMTAADDAVSVGLTSAAHGENTYDVTSEYGAAHEMATTAGYPDEVNVLSYALVIQDRGAEYSGSLYREDDLFVEVASQRIAQTAVVAKAVSQSAYVMTAAGAAYQIASLENEADDLASAAKQQSRTAPQSNQGDSR